MLHIVLQMKFEHFLDFIVLRLSCLAFSTSWFVPDEVFQSIEIAYRMVYGQGYRTWEWEPKWALRSTLHPLLFGVIFWLLRVLRLDFVWLIVWTPNIVHALIFAATDVCYLKWLRQLGQSRIAYDVTRTFYTFNWFILYCSTRTLSNTLECCLSILALNLYEDGVKHRSSAKQVNNAELSSFGRCICCVSIATILRPTTILIWAPLILFHIWELSTFNGCLLANVAAKRILSLMPYGLVPLAFSTIIDSIYYGSPVICLWNFVQFNVIQGGSAHFGTHPWHWYFTQGLPPLLTLLIIPFFTFLYHWHRFQTKRYMVVACVYIVGHSLIAHKEHRFLLPILPFVFPYFAEELCAYKIQLRNFIKYAYIISNISLAIYFGLVHQRGPSAVNAQVYDLVSEYKPSERTKILQLMPCFSLPQYAHLHPYANKTDIRMLDCTPRSLKKGNTAIILDEYNYSDESEQFYEQPEGWLNREWYTSGLFDAHIIVAYDRTYVKIERFLMLKGFGRHSLIFHTHFTTSTKQSSWIVISKRKF